jgi:deoxyribodipyrimidine photo-lyase
MGGYPEERDVVADDTSRLSVHLRFGTLSARWLEERVRAAGGPGSQRFRDELAWRDFLASVLARHPEAAREELQERYRGTLAWEDDDEALEAWKRGRTGYPLVDAAMRQLLATGWMHNRARLVTASFLVKDAGVDWRRGEAVFLDHLLDADTQQNNGNWQWVAGVGTDAAPYFRIFNPTLQAKKFDPDGAYVKRWIPELAGVPDAFIHEPWRAPEPPADYPPPMLDHAEARARSLDRYRAVSRT